MNFTSAKQLKDWVRNLSQKTGVPSSTLMQNYLMERFVERVSVSEYRHHLILKGGYLIAAMIGSDKRSTMDIDTTLKGLPASREQVERMLNETAAINLNDGASFNILSIKPIHEDGEYDDFRVSMDVSLYTIRGNLKIDLTVGDTIIPREIEYAYQLMFEEKTIPVMAYNLYTILAEKIETILSRNVSNTRGRDYYDVSVLMKQYQNEINRHDLIHAVRAKAEERGSLQDIENYAVLLDQIGNSPEIHRMWKQYTSRYPYASGMELGDILHQVKRLFERQ